jgi:hypothetical protein
MADDAAAVKKKRTFKKFQFRGMDLETMLELTNEVYLYPLIDLH